MKSHKKQHFVPRSYLKAWCDPETPPGHEPYVWVFDRDGTSSRRRAPANIFHETDMYTIQLPNGGRDLVVEHGLAQLESEFVSLRETYLERHRLLKQSRYAIVCAFVAAMQERNPAQRDHLSEQWGRVLELADHISAWAKTASPEEMRAMAPISESQSSDRIPYEHVKAMAEQPLQTGMITAIRVQTPLLMKLDSVILTTDGPEFFITSDNPCVWFDPESRNRPPMEQSPALMYETIEITMPLSPRQLIFFNRRRVNGHAVVDQEIVRELNRRTRWACNAHFISRSNSMNPIWLQNRVVTESESEEPAAGVLP